LTSLLANLKPLWEDDFKDDFDLVIISESHEGKFYSLRGVINDIFGEEKEVPEITHLGTQDTYQVKFSEETDRPTIYIGHCT